MFTLRIYHHDEHLSGYCSCCTSALALSITHHTKDRNKNDAFARYGARGKEKLAHVGFWICTKQMDNRSFLMWEAVSHVLK